MTFNVRDWRKSQGDDYTQTEAAGDLGVSLATWRSWEYGRRKPPKMLKALIDAKCQQIAAPAAQPGVVVPGPKKRALVRKFLCVQLMLQEGDQFLILTWAFWDNVDPRKEFEDITKSWPVDCILCEAYDYVFDAQEWLENKKKT